MELSFIDSQYKGCFYSRNIIFIYSDDNSCELFIRYISDKKLIVKFNNEQVISDKVIMSYRNIRLNKGLKVFDFLNLNIPKGCALDEYINLLKIEHLLNKKVSSLSKEDTNLLLFIICLLSDKPVLVFPNINLCPCYKDFLLSAIYTVGLNKIILVDSYNELDNALNYSTAFLYLKDNKVIYLNRFSIRSIVEEFFKDKKNIISIKNKPKRYSNDIKSYELQKPHNSITYTLFLFIFILLRYIKYR